MLSTKTIMLILSAMLFFVGAVVSVLFLGPENSGFFINPAVDLAIISIGIFFLSIFYWGRFAFIPVFFAGIWAGGLFGKYPIYCGFAVLPILMAVANGHAIGKKAMNDLKGKENLFDNSIDKQYC